MRAELLRIRHALAGFDNERVERRYHDHLDSIAFNWIRGLVLIISVLAGALIAIQGEFILDDFSTLKLYVHLACVALIIVGPGAWQLVGKHVLPTKMQPGRFAFLLCTALMVADRVYHLSFLVGWSKWARTAQDFIIVDAGRAGIFQTAVGPVATSIGIPLTFKAMMLLRVITEVIEAAVMVKVCTLFDLDISIWARVLTRTLLSLFVGLLIDITRREAFLKSHSKVSATIQAGAKMPARANISYNPVFPSEEITQVTLKTSPYCHQSEESLPQCDIRDLTRCIKAQHPEAYPVYLKTRKGCLVDDTVICGSPANNPLDISSLITKLQPETQVPRNFQTPMMVRSHVTSINGVTTCLFVLEDGRWRKVEEVNVAEPQFTLTLDPVICLPVGARSKKLFGVWEGHPPPTGSWLEAVVHGQPVKITCFPEPSSWSHGSQVKLTLFLDDLTGHDQHGGTININLWALPAPWGREASPSLPQAMVVSSKVLLLPATGSEGAVEELLQIFSQARGTPAKPWGDYDGLAQDLSMILFASSDALSLANMELIPKLIIASRAVIQWAKKGGYPCLEQVVMKAEEKIQRHQGLKMQLFAGLYVCRSIVGRPSRPNHAWVSMFGLALALGFIKSLVNDGTGMINLLTFLPYGSCILCHTVGARRTEGALVKGARLLLDHGGVFLAISRALIGLSLLSPNFAFARHTANGLEKFFGDWSSFAATYLVTKTCYAVFEPVEIRLFTLLVLGIDAPIMIGLLWTQIQCSLPFSVVFSILANVYCIVIRVLYDRWQATRGRIKTKRD